MGLGGIASIANTFLGDPNSQLVADPSSFTIEELGGQKRKVTLTGRALPYRPFELVTTQRLTTTWLPGYAEATATVLGASEEPSAINGWWKDRFIGVAEVAASPSPLGAALGALQNVSGALTGGFGAPATPGDPMVVADGEGGETSVVSARDAATLFDSIVREGQLLEVAWDQQVRHGFLKKFRKLWHNAHDLEWDMDFEWTGRGERAPPPDTQQGEGDLFSALEQALDDIFAIVAEVQAIDAGIRDAILSQVQVLTSLVQLVGTAVAAVASVASIPADAARLISGLLQSIIGECKAIRDLLDAQPYAAMHRDAQPATRFGSTQGVNQVSSPLSSGSSGGGSSPTSGGTSSGGTANGSMTSSTSTAQSAALGVAGLTTTQRTTIVDWAKRLITALRVLSDQSVDRRARILALVELDLVAATYARAGEDLRDIARRFYGDASDWRRILLFNGFSSATLTAGQLVLVPRSTVGT